MNRTELIKKFDYVDLLDALADCWNQFAIEGKNGKFAGGLSTLRCVEGILRDHNLLLAGNKIDWIRINYLRDEVNK